MKHLFESIDPVRHSPPAKLRYSGRPLAIDSWQNTIANAQDLPVIALNGDTSFQEMLDYCEREMILACMLPAHLLVQTNSGLSGSANANIHSG